MRTVEVLATPGLEERFPGLCHWRVPAPEWPPSGEKWYASPADVPPLLRGGKVRDTMFPMPLVLDGTGDGGRISELSDDSIDDDMFDDDAWLRRQLRRCVRVLPGADHGGFFLAVIAKGEAGDFKSPAPPSPSATARAPEAVASATVAMGTASSPPAATPLLRAGARAVLREGPGRGHTVTVVGPGDGRAASRYRGLVKIKHVDGSTFHVAPDNLIAVPDTPILRPSASAARRGETSLSGCDERNCNTSGGTGGRGGKWQPGAHLVRRLSPKAPRHIVTYFGLRCEDTAIEDDEGMYLGRRNGQKSPGASDSTAAFPWLHLGVKRCDLATIWLGSSALLASRIPTRGGDIRILDAGAPLFRRVIPIRHGADGVAAKKKEAAKKALRVDRNTENTDDEGHGDINGGRDDNDDIESEGSGDETEPCYALKKWGEGCPSRPTHEAAPLLALLATRRTVKCTAEVILQMLQLNNDRGISPSLRVSVPASTGDVEAVPPAMSANGGSGWSQGLGEHRKKLLFCDDALRASLEGNLVGLETCLLKNQSPTKDLRWEDLELGSVIVSLLAPKIGVGDSSAVLHRHEQRAEWLPLRNSDDFGLGLDPSSVALVGTVCLDGIEIFPPSRDEAQRLAWLLRGILRRRTKHHAKSAGGS